MLQQHEMFGRFWSAEFDGYAWTAVVVPSGETMGAFDLRFFGRGTTRKEALRSAVSTPYALRLADARHILRVSDEGQGA